MVLGNQKLLTLRDGNSFYVLKDYCVLTFEQKLILKKLEALAGILYFYSLVIFVTCYIALRKS